MLNEYLSKVLAICAEEFDVEVREVLSRSKKQELVYCRKAFCIIIKETLDVKLEVLAKKLGRKDGDVSMLIARQPDNKYYNACLRRIRSRVRPFGEE